MHSQLKRFSWSFFAAESSHFICIYKLSVYTKFISKNYFYFNPVDFRQMYICIIAFLLSNLSRRKRPVGYFLLTKLIKNFVLFFSTFYEIDAKGDTFLAHL